MLGVPFLLREEGEEGSWLEGEEREDRRGVLYRRDYPRVRELSPLAPGLGGVSVSSERL